MTSTCPSVDSLHALPFAHDRVEAYHQLLGAPDVGITPNGIYLLTGADVVEHAAKCPEVFSSHAAFSAIGSPVPLVPIEFDPPEHSHYRRALDRFFSPRSMAERESTMRELVGELIDEIVAAGDTCELMSALAIPFPSQMFLSLFGLPLEDKDQLLRWKDAIFGLGGADGVNAPEESQLQLNEMATYLSDCIASRRGGQGNDLLSQLLGAESDGLSESEILGLCIIFVFAGLDTVTAATGFLFNALARDPGLRQRVIADPSVVPELIEEVLRVDSPVPFVPRITTEEVEIGRVTIPRGAMCWLVFSAANRDPRRYDEPDELHQSRSNHFAFGRGVHRCLGSHLARLEMKIMVEEWNRRIPHYSLVEEPTIKWPNVTLAFGELNLKIG